MQIAIFSDTHGYLADSIPSIIDGCDLIIHAGDIGHPDIIDSLISIAPVKAVLGNCDYPIYGDDIRATLSLVIDGIRIFVAHTPRDAGVERTLNASRFANAKWNLERNLNDIVLPDLVIYGHTHKRERKIMDSVTVINPGSASASRDADGKNSIAILTIENACIESVEFVYV